MNTLEKLNDMKQKGFELDFGETFNHTFQNYKKTALLSGVVFLLFIIVASFLWIGIAGILLGIGSFRDMMAGKPQMLEQSPLMLIGTFFMNVLVAGCVAPLTAGYYKMNHNAAINEEVKLETAFEYYRSKYFRNIFLSAVFIASFLYAITTACRFIFMPNMLDYIKHPNLGVMMLYVISIYASFILVYFFTCLSTPFIIFGNLSPTQAISKSIWVVFKKFWVILGILFVSVVFFFVGIIGLCIGIFFTAPIVYSAIYSIYSSAVGIENKSEIDEIGMMEF
jgi:hypothetical protein